MMKTSPVTGAGASDPNAELFRVITSEPPCKGAGVDPQGGGRPPPGLHELIEKPVQNIVTEAVTQTDYQADSRRKFNM